MYNRFIYAIKRIDYYKVIKAIVLLNLFDLIFTLLGIGFGYVGESNVFMNYILGKSLVGFILVKLSVIFLFFFVCMTYIDRIGERIKRLLIVPLCVYGFIIALHIYYGILAILYK